MDPKLTRLQAYKVMYVFLDEYYFKTKSNDVGSLLKQGVAHSSLSTHAWNDWVRCTNLVLQDTDNKYGYLHILSHDTMH